MNPELLKKAKDLAEFFESHTVETSDFGAETLINFHKHENPQMHDKAFVVKSDDEEFSGEYSFSFQELSEARVEGNALYIYSEDDLWIFSVYKKEVVNIPEGLFQPLIAAASLKP